MNSRSDARQQRTYLVTEHRRGRISEARLTPEEKDALDPEGVDFLYDYVTGQYRIRKEDGASLEYFGDLPGVGDTLGRMLLDLMWRPGELLSPKTLVHGVKGAPKYVCRLVYGRLYTLRRTFGESARKPWYFRVRRYPYSICWSARRSWRFIELMAQPEDDDDGDVGRRI